MAFLLPNSFYGRRFNPDETAINAVEFFIRNLGGHVGIVEDQRLYKIDFPAGNFQLAEVYL